MAALGKSTRCKIWCLAERRKELRRQRGLQKNRWMQKLPVGASCKDKKILKTNQSKRLIAVRGWLSLSIDPPLFRSWIFKRIQGIMIDHGRTGFRTNMNRGLLVIDRKGSYVKVDYYKTIGNALMQVYPKERGSP